MQCEMPPKVASGAIRRDGEITTRLPEPTIPPNKKNRNREDCTTIPVLFGVLIAHFPLIL